MIRSARLAGRLAALAAVGAACVAFVTDACVLVEDTSDLPKLPQRRPTIVHGSVVPSTARVLTTFPVDLVIPVEVSDPTQPIQYSVFVDYNSVTGEGNVGQPVTLATGNRTTVIAFRLDPPVDFKQCHTVEVVVALRFESDKTPQTSHTPAPPGGDVVTWFYNPNGDFGCPSLDAGIDTGVDAGADADATAEGGEGGVN